jgi:hypothetical protein
MSRVLDLYLSSINAMAREDKRDTFWEFSHERSKRWDALETRNCLPLDVRADRCPLTASSWGIGMGNYTKQHFDFDNLPWLTNPRRQLDLQAVALGLIRIPPNKGYTFTHRHERQEEVYIVIEGEGVLLVDGELIDIERGDMVRVSPSSRRALKANGSGVMVICSGAVPMGYPRNPNARYMIDDGIPDYDDIPPWYKDDPSVAEQNARLKKRMVSPKRKRGS